MKDKTLLIGKIFGKLTVIKFSSITKRKTRSWVCRCVCGNERIIETASLISGNSKSCGCSRDGNPTHKMTYTNDYLTWAAMIQRCANPNSKSYKHYGGRGIKVCKRWRNSKNFFADMGQRPSLEYSIDRIDNNKGYSKSNCRWATRAGQAVNRRNTRVFLYSGELLPLSQIAKKVGVRHQSISHRIDKYKMSLEDAIRDAVEKSWVLNPKYNYIPLQNKKPNA